MAELVLSALLPVLFEKLASTALKNIARYKGIDAEIKKWQRSLIQIQNVLTDASHKEITNEAVKRWLNDLQHVAYDLDDVLDDLATEAIDREFNRESEGMTNKVRKLIPTCCTSFSRNTTMLAQLDDISTKLQDLLEEKAALGLSVKEETKSTNKNRRLQTSMLDASRIVGRQAEKEALVQELLSPCDQSYSIVPIVGMGGIGKTTLAKLLYDDQQVKDHFEFHAWVCVSNEFDSFAISKVIFQSISEDNKKFEDLNLLQVAIRDHLRGKRFLLVLDDVWSESCDDWETLVGPFHACAPGSKIIMTTRKDQLLRKLGYNNLNQLQSLSSEDALSLIALYALGQVNNFDSHLSLKAHGEGIVQKCNSLPLALKAVGRLLSTNKDEEYWKNVLDSEIWNLPVEGEIIPALKLSYYDLSARLKQLFAYCSLFPKDYLFDKEELVLIWMGEGFLHQSRPGHLTEESMGRKYFDELFSRSFFQYAPNHESLFVMHDMMNDLATYVASEFFVRLDVEEKKDIGKGMLEKYHHMSFVRERYVTYKKFELLEKAKRLRTFLATSVEEVQVQQFYSLSNKVLTDLLLKLPMLRVLCLSRLEIIEVPESIGSLRHLRYLNLSRNPIKHLPENVCNLYNLETLVLCECHRLYKLPNNLSKLKNLRHLDIRGTLLLKEMPLGIGEMKRLQTLSKIIIGGESLFEITKLKELKNLCGKISIVGLDKVQSATHAREANLSQKRLSELELIWSQPCGSRNDTLEKEVMNELKPCNDKLMQLTVRSYRGLEFPNWIGDPSFLKLKHVSISDCKRCTCLPPLGQLPLLKELFIGGLDGVRVVGLELLGTGLSFRSLEVISFKDMPWWEKWSTSRRVLFPSLQKLCIENCPELIEVSPGALPSLNVLEIGKSQKLIEVSLGALPSLSVLDIDSCDCDLLRGLVQVASSVSVLEMKNISRLDDAVWRGVIGYLKAVEELKISGCNEIRYLWESEAVASKVLMKLKKLQVVSCYNLVTLGEKQEDDCRRNLLTSLMMLKVYNCDNIESCICPDSIESLDVRNCSSIITISLPTQKLKSLWIWGCHKLLEREWGGRNINGSGMLEYAHLKDWPNLKSIAKLDYFVHLTGLGISDCKCLESFPNHELSKLTSLRHLQITNCPSMDASFTRGVWPPSLCTLRIGKLKKPISEWGAQNFPTSLVSVLIYGENGVSSCSQLSHLLPSSLTSLTITAFEKLELTSIGLQHLTSLQRLSFENCPNMMDLPEALLPSLLSLQIDGSPKLKERCSKEGSYWPLIFHIPHIFISRDD